MKKRVLSILMAGVLTLGNVIPVYANPDVTEIDVDNFSQVKEESMSGEEKEESVLKEEETESVSGDSYSELDTDTNTEYDPENGDSRGTQEKKPGGAWEFIENGKGNSYIEETIEISNPVLYDGLAKTVATDTKYDPRISNSKLITPLKSQQGGTCWAYGSMAAAESSLINSGLATNSVDLSEFQMVYFTYNKNKDPRGNIDCDYNVAHKGGEETNKFSDICDAGGNGTLIMNQLANWCGPISESSAEFTSTNDSMSLPLEKSYESEYHVKNVKACTTEIANMSAMKNLISKYGGGTISILYNSKYCKDIDGTTTCYNNEYESSNHLVEIIGWDDDYPKEKFANPPEENGAWLIKNSWGKKGYFSSNGDGYAWVSYYDKSLNRKDSKTKSVMHVYEFEDAALRTNNYQYDGSDGCNSTISTSCMNVYTANAYANGNIECLSSVGVTVDAESKFNVFVYSNPVFENDRLVSYDNKTSTGDVTADYYGYYTLDLQQPLYVVDGDKFAVYVELESGKIYLARSGVVSDSDGNGYKSYENIGAGQCFYGAGNNYFYDVLDYNTVTPRIKAFTNPTTYTKATDITLKTNESLKKGQSVRLSATVLPANALQEVTWYSDNESVAKVASDGTVTATGCGSCSVHAVSQDKKVDKVCSIKVLAQTESVTLNMKTMELDEGSNEQLKVTVLPTSSSQTVLWSSSNEAVATVDASGKVTAKAAGECKITAKSYDGLKTDTCDVKVYTKVQSVKITPEQLVMVLGESDNLKITATVLPSTANQKTNFSSSDTKVVSVDEQGNLTAKKTGTARITVKDHINLKSAVCTVTVYDKAESIAFTDDRSECFVGDTYYFDKSVRVIPETAIQEFKLKVTSDRDVVFEKVIDEIGFGVLAKSAGVYTVTAVAAGGRLTESHEIKVYDYVENVTIGDTSFEVGTGEKKQVSATVVPDTADQHVVWKSSDESIATVDNEGNVIGISSGSCEIWAVGDCDKGLTGHGNISSQHCSVTVKNYVSDILIETEENGELYVEPGKSYQLLYHVLPASADASAVTFASSDVSVLNFDAAGNAVTQKEGTVMVTAKATDRTGVEKTVCVHVIKPVNTLTVNGNNIENGRIQLFVNNSTVIWGQVNYDATNQIVKTYVKDPSIAVYNAETKSLQAVSAGTTKIIFETVPGAVGSVWENDSVKAGKVLTTECEIVVQGLPAADDTFDDENGTSSYICLSPVTKEVSLSAGPKNVKEYTIPDTVTYGGTEYKITAIDKEAFSNNKELQSIKIGNNITCIEVKAFYNCRNLKKLSLGKNLTYISDQAFYNCISLQSLSIPSKVYNIGDSAFANCKGLKKITLGKNLTTIGNNAFMNCSSVKSITIPSKVNKIGKKAFYNCKKLNKVTIKSTKLKSVGSSAFKKIAKKAVIKVPKAKYKSYLKLFKKKYDGTMK